MTELVFLKLGGSLLTDKTRPQALRSGVLTRLASEIAAALGARPGTRLLIGHGSGSFGHVVANRYGTRNGVRSPAEWRGYGETATVAARLNRLVVEALEKAGIPVLPIQPSASARAHDGELTALELRPIRAAVENGLAPVVYGDVALDDVRGGTVISTEQIFHWLAQRLAPRRILLVGEVPGVLTANPAELAAGSTSQVIAEITPADLPDMRSTLGGSRGVDVTGGMLAKVDEMAALVVDTPSLSAVEILSGLTPGLLQTALTDPRARTGTRICRHRTRAEG